MSRREIHEFSERVATAIQKWIVDALSDEMGTLHGSADVRDGSVSEEPSSSSNAATPLPSADPVALVPKSWYQDLETLFGLTGANSHTLEQIGLCIRRYGEVATNYAIGQVLMNPKIRGDYAMNTIKKIVERFRLDMIPEPRPQKDKQVQLRPDVLRKDFETQAESVF